MRKYLFLIVVLILTSCSEQYLENEVSVVVNSETAVSNFETVKEQAKWGSGDAYLKLAHCYHDGIGVKCDFVSMLCMADLARQYGALNGLEEFIKCLPADSEYRIAFEALIQIDGKEYDMAYVLAERLMSQGCAEGYAIKGILAIEHRNIAEFRSLCKLAAEKGSTFGELLLCLKDWKYSLEFDIQGLLLLADRIPLANLMLAAHYADLTNSEKNYDKMASYFYLRADKSGLLGKKNARWLLNYYKNGGIRTIDDEDYARIKKLAGEDR